ncbi:PREDICTED: insulinoma-associated protein 1a-like [Priapulus caudatus]|uniref:Insulinoma-associated protein 1a-like n=1 Tax=Priapulus caudatus TaxID=37621 RepID=A0ABM1DT79_PRICU|nr:PREDICTED: insulinoma-associated protein 1a-like [Priapulus caudatus]
MPRGFLVKRRARPHVCVSYRAASVSDDDRSDDRSDSDDHTDVGSQSAWSPEPARNGNWNVGRPRDENAHQAAWSPEPPAGGRAWMPTLCRPDKWSPELWRAARSSPIRVPLYRGGGGGGDSVSDRDSPLSLDSRSPGSTASSSPLPLSIHPYFTAGTSPLLYINGFDKLSVHSPGNMPATPKRATPTRPDNSSSPSSMSSPSKRRLVGDHGKPRTPKKSRAARRLCLDDETASPVSGTIIRAARDSDDAAADNNAGDDIVVEKCADIDAALNLVAMTPEACADLAKIENRIGAYVCQLCKHRYEDAFQLAQHRCSRIVYIEYRCPECDKVFNCPANLASHRRWHKPKPEATSPPREEKSDGGDAPREEQRRLEETTCNSEGEYRCGTCGKTFKRQAYLRKHMQAHHVGGAPATPPRRPPTFDGGADRVRHVLALHGGAAGAALRQHRCIVCGCGFGTRAELDKHARTHVSDTYPCKYCDSTFFTSPGLTRHINKCHPTENRQVILLQLPTI